MFYLSTNVICGPLRRQRQPAAAQGTQVSGRSLGSTCLVHTPLHTLPQGREQAVVALPAASVSSARCRCLCRMAQDRRRSVLGIMVLLPHAFLSFPPGSRSRRWTAVSSNARGVCLCGWTCAGCAPTWPSGACWAGTSRCRWVTSAGVGYVGSNWGTLGRDS